jgi:hypothetical protein
MTRKRYFAGETNHQLILRPPPPQGRSQSENRRSGRRFVRCPHRFEGSRQGRTRAFPRRSWVKVLMMEVWKKVTLAESGWLRTKGLIVDRPLFNREGSYTKQRICWTNCTSVPRFSCASAVRDGTITKVPYNFLLRVSLS